MREGTIFDEINQKRACAHCAKMFSKGNRLAQGGQRRKGKTDIAVR